MIKVTFGEHDRCNDTKRPESRFVLRAVAGAFSFLNFDNDIALLRLNDRVPITDNIRPICLPKNKGNVSKWAVFKCEYLFIELTPSKAACSLVDPSRTMWIASKYSKWNVYVPVQSMVLTKIDAFGYAIEKNTKDLFYVARRNYFSCWTIRHTQHRILTHRLLGALENLLK